VDLGAGDAMTLENVTDRNVFSQKTIPGNLGVGIKGRISGYLGRVKAIDIGKYKLKDLIASFPEKDSTKILSVPRNGNLGVDILKKFTIVFDYLNSAIYLKPSSGFAVPFEHDMSGLEYYATGDDLNRIIIERVEPGSPGEAAGLVKDDEITAINFKPVSSMTLEQIDNIFSSRDNRILFLDVYHDQKFTTLITLKRRI
jgi:membrane-associated protease RseP (regulator of RpoE activity)